MNIIKTLQKLVWNKWPSNNHTWHTQRPSPATMGTAGSATQYYFQIFSVCNQTYTVTLNTALSLHRDLTLLDRKHLKAFSTYASCLLVILESSSSMLQLIFTFQTIICNFTPFFQLHPCFLLSFITVIFDEFSKFHVKVRVLGLGFVIASAMASLVTKGPGAFWCASSRLWSDLSIQSWYNLTTAQREIWWTKTLGSSTGVTWCHEETRGTRKVLKIRLNIFNSNVSHLCAECPPLGGICLAPGWVVTQLLSCQRCLHITGLNDTHRDLRAVQRAKG